MGGGVGSDEFTVLCGGCANPIGAHAQCPICGDTRGSSGTPLAADQLDEALLNQVGVALAAQLELATHTAAARIETSASLVEQSLRLRRRLRRQSALLRDRVAERGQQAHGLSDALARIDNALLASGGPSRARPDWSLRARLPRDRTCPMVARRLLEGHAGEDLDVCQAENAILIVSELATNALLHGEGIIGLVVSRRGDRLRIEVSDEGRPTNIGMVPNGRRGIGGRGLFIVDQLASAWGTDRGTAHVWAELALT